VPYMIWQKIRPDPGYHHEIIRKVFAAETVQAYEWARTPAGLLLKAARLWHFFLGPALTLPVLILVFVLPAGFGWRHMSKQTRLLLVICAVFFLAVGLETFCEPHYVSPITSLILALILLALRRLRNWRSGGKQVGLFLARATPAICVLTFALRVFAKPLYITVPSFYVAAWDQKPRGDFGRAKLQASLERLPGRQLVIVRYGPHHETFCEWVYNEADIDGAKVVWARDMGSVQNRELIRYFEDRQVFLLEADSHPPRLTAYDSSSVESESECSGARSCE